jgi:hypothetical protein
MNSCGASSLKFGAGVLSSDDGQGVGTKELQRVNGLSPSIILRSRAAPPPVIELGLHLGLSVFICFQRKLTLKFRDASNYEFWSA